MHLRMWMVDIAREQSPSYEHLRTFLDATREGGYNAIGLYLEHRFAYPSTPWAHGKGAVTPDMIEHLQRDYKDIQIIPFVNLLGHYEGMLYTEYGKRYREELFKGMQADPSNPEFVDLAGRIIDDTIAIFKSEIIHIGGDETWQLGQCAKCKERVAEYEGSDRDTAIPQHRNTESPDGKALLYGHHFGPLAQRVVDAGRRPAVWGDMFFDHPQALELIPKETLIFDWRYFGGNYETSKKLQDKGFEVVGCPAIHTYNATWCHLPQSEMNVRQVARDSVALGLHGVCVTTWENGLMGNYETILPAIVASGKILRVAEDMPTELSAPPLTPSAEDLAGLTINPTDQLTDPNDSFQDAVSIANGVALGVVAMAVKAATCRITMEPRSDGASLSVEAPIGRTPSGSIDDAEIAAGVARRLRLWANLDPIRDHNVEMGAITGTCGGQPFRLNLRTERTPLGLQCTLSSEQFAALDYADLTDAPAFLAEYRAKGEQYEGWARLMGCELQAAGGTFRFGGIRSSLKVRLLLNANPFLAWLHHQEELTGEVGDKALALLDHAIQAAPDAATRGVSEFARGAIEFVRYADQARQAYAQELPGVAIASLSPCRQLFDNMARTAKATHLRIGGSLADIERCRVAREHVETAIRRIKEFGDGSLGYLPAFEHLTHPKFMPHDQAAWWLINRWANE
jgi:hypothetical protein